MKRLVSLLAAGAAAAFAAEPPPLVPGQDPVLLQPHHAAAVRELERQAALGVGLKQQPAIADEPPLRAPAAPMPTNRELGIGVPKGEFRAQKWREEEAVREARRAQAQEQNRQAGEKLTQHYNDLVSRCGEPLPQWPQLGMGIAELNCTLSMRLGSDTTQQLLLERGGHRYQLLVMRGSPLRRLWLLDLRVVRVDGLRPPP
jgi:hypothetical protein